MNITTHSKQITEGRRFRCYIQQRKCEFKVDEEESYRYSFTKDGLKPTTEKLKAVKDSKREEHFKGGDRKRQLHKLYRRIVKEDWQKQRKDIATFFGTRHDLYVTNGLILRFNQNGCPVMPSVYGHGNGTQPRMHGNDKDKANV